MSYFDDASLVFIPSGTKVSKAYSVKPIDGSGDLTFTRSNDTATRVNSAGLIEKVRTNLVLQSNTFNTTWTTTTASVTSGQAGYDGTNNAWLLTKSAGSGRVSQSFNATAGLTTFSVYAKANASSYIAIEFSTSYIYVNLTNGAQGSIGAGTYKIESIGSGWYRISMTTGAASSIFRIYPAENNDLAATSGSIFIQNAQIETGDIATPYIATTTAAVSVGPVANVPRLDYLNSTCPKLLLEPQRVNLALFSESFNNAGWNKAAASVTANNSVSPDGYTNADLITSSGAAGYVYPSNTNVFGAAAGATYSYSVYLKAGTASIISLLVSATATYTGVFNLSTGVATTSTANTTASMSSVGNGWYRCVIVCASVANSAYSELQIGRVASGLTFSAYGAQLEAGAYASSYIPTLGASVTRGADSSSSASIPSLFGTTEGSFFIECTFDGRNSNGAIPLFLRSSVSTSFNQATYLQFGASNVVLNVYSGTTAQAAITGGSFTNGQTLKIAFGYKANDFVLYVNGVQIGTDTSGAISTSLSFIDLGSYLLLQSTYQYDGKISQALLFKTRLSNSSLAELTTI